MGGNKMAEQTAVAKTARIGLSDATVFTDCIRTVSNLVAETSITLDSEGLGIIAMDPANVAMVVFKMKQSEFLEWSVDADTEFAIKLGDLKQVLSRADKNTTLFLQLENNKLKVILAGKNGKKKEFSLATLDLESKKQKMPDLKFSAEVSIDNQALKDAIADVTIVAESIEFKIGDKKFSVAGKGDSNSVTSEVEAVVKEVSTDGKPVAFKSKYSIEYLDKFVAAKISKTLKLHLGKDYPSKFVYVNDKGTTSLEFLLAPRIEND